MCHLRLRHAGRDTAPHCIVMQRHRQLAETLHSLAPLQGTHRLHEPGRSGFGRDTTFSKPITELGKVVLDE
jgi:hypothetical protein